MHWFKKKLRIQHGIQSFIRGQDHANCLYTESTRSGVCRGKVMRGCGAEAAAWLVHHFWSLQQQAKMMLPVMSNQTLERTAAHHVFTSDD
jgi:hypothetical protein